jgi:uncharacterized protein (DUF302 family)
VITKRSSLDYATTLRRLTDAVEHRGLTLFARIDHAAGAREVGLELPDEEVILFGNPRAGTPLMQSDPRIGIELPLRILVWQESEGVEIGYKDPRESAGDYDVAEHEAALTAMAGLLSELVNEAAG